MWIEEDESNEEVLHIVTSQRIGIDSAGIEWASKPLRFYVLGSLSVSRRDKISEKQLQEMMRGFP
jgi:DNA-3-methyladenine glycosylase